VAPKGSAGKHIKRGEAVKCPECQEDFEPNRPHQVYCSRACRNDHHAGSDGWLRGAVVSVRKLRNGKTSVVVRFDAIEAGNALRLDVGRIIEVIQ
jgi:endogenous inhibitor of DNA gyrase (YacG/DUF329 family)